MIPFINDLVKVILVIVGYEHQHPLVARKILIPQLGALRQVPVFPPPVIEHQQRVHHLHREPGMMKIGDDGCFFHEILLTESVVFQKNNRRGGMKK